MSNPFNIGMVYTFNALAPAILGQTFTAAKVMAVMNYELAQATNYINPAQMHATVYPSIDPAKRAQDDYTTYTYILFQTSTSNKVVLALEWIDQNTITQTQYNTVVVTLSQINTALTDINRIRESLILAGIANSNNISIELK